MKKNLGSAALALTLAASLSTAALAADRPMNPTIAPRPDQPLISARPYANTLILNGDTLDTSAIPFMEDTSLVPMRLVAESDYGSAEWLKEEGMGSFYLGQSLLQVTFATGEIVLNDETLATTGVLNSGVTFIPAAELDKVEGFDVTVSGSTIEITTPNNDPLIKAGMKIASAAGDAFGMRSTPEEMKEYYSIPVEQFDSVFGLFPMMTTPDTVVVGKLKAGADEEAVKAALEAYRAKQEETFTWYLSHNLPKVQNAKTVVEDGWFLFLIGEDADAGVEAFKTFVAAQKNG